jgi:hypothetical protein
VASAKWSDPLRLVHFGEYRTKRLILEIYDPMAAAIADGPPFDTVLDPPPGSGRTHAPRA